MSAYIIAIYDVTDQEGYQKYLEGVGETVARHGGELVIADFAAQHLEGDKRGVYVVVRFESQEEAMSWYSDPDYKPLRDIRLASTANVSTVLARQFVDPT